MTTDEMINIASYLDGEMCYATYGVTFETAKQAYEALIFGANKIKALEKERREMVCAAMETCDLIHNGDYQEAYNYLEENFERIYNEA